MADAFTVYAVFGSEEEAERIAGAMIEQELAACANILGAVTSIYRWEGKIERSAEVPVLFKRSGDPQPLIDAIAAMHSYDVPSITAWSIVAGQADYLAWLEE